ncbi:hypothetical protein OHV93_17050 [Acinetobacter baumannii]|nr:hypothetical protein [Acinetobacter baumannii]MDC4919658.1 hypothetical protein [Acinetobacter baumannii]MDC4934112.1 hypothetical protein [Acinetobacter baumannii]
MNESETLYTNLGKIQLLRSYSGLDTTVLNSKYNYFSIAADKYFFINTSSGVLAGYITWASINRDTYMQLKTTGNFPRYYHEWIEGNITLILDVVIIPEWRKSLIKELLIFFKKHDKIVFIRQDTKVKRFNKQRVIL